MLFVYVILLLIIYIHIPDLIMKVVVVVVVWVEMCLVWHALAHRLSMRREVSSAGNKNFHQ
jgi:hypothetical protein